MACIRCHAIDTNPAILARVRVAIVHIRAAICAGEAVHTGAGVIIDTIVAFPAVLTRVRVAIVNVGLAVVTRVALLTGAGVLRDPIDA